MNKHYCVTNRQDRQNLCLWTRVNMSNQHNMNKSHNLDQLHYMNKRHQMHMRPTMEKHR
jgi:hypothetical protein